MPDIVLKYLQVGSEGGFTSGAGSVYNGGTAVSAARRLAVEDSTEFGYADLVWEAPEEARGSYAAIAAHHLQMRMVKGKYGGLMYGDELVYWMRAVASGAPVVSTLPTTPNVLLAATATATTNTVLTTQPNNATFGGVLGQMIAITLAKATADPTLVTFTLTGTDVSGAVLTESVTFTNGTTTPSKVGGGAGATSCTLYTKNYFATVTNFTASAAVAGETAALGGVAAFLWLFVPDMNTSTLYSLTGEWFDGATPWQLPGLVVPKFDFDFTLGKSAKFKGDALARDIQPMGAMTALSDAVFPAITTAGMRYYSDPIGAVPGTTASNGRLVIGTFGIENLLTLGKAADGTPLANFVGRKRYKTKGEFTLLFNNGQSGSEDPADFAAFQRTYQSRTILIAATSDNYLPSGPWTFSGQNWPASLVDGTGKGGLYGVTLAHAGKFTVGTPANHEGRLAVKLTHDMEVDYKSMNAAYQVQVVCRLNPNIA